MWHDARWHDKIIIITRDIRHSNDLWPFGKDSFYYEHVCANGVFLVLNLSERVRNPDGLLEVQKKYPKGVPNKKTFKILIHTYDRILGLSLFKKNDEWSYPLHSIHTLYDTKWHHQLMVYVDLLRRLERNVHKKKTTGLPSSWKEKVSDAWKMTSRI